jgi:anti-anti-sigma factor
MMFTKLFEGAAHADRLGVSPASESVRRIPQIEVRSDEAPGEVIVRIAGEASIEQADQLTGALLGLSCRRPPLITLDLTGLSFVSSLAMGVLVAFRQGVVRAGSRVRLGATLQEPVREALARAELLTLFDWPAEAEVDKADAEPPVSTPSPFPSERKTEVKP